MASRNEKSSRGFAIFVRTGAFLAASCALGCSGTGGADSPPPEKYADGEGNGGGVVHAPGAERNPHPKVDPKPDAGSDGGARRPANGCPELTFPSGARIQTKPNAAMTKEYEGISDTGSYPLPKCFIDTDDLYDPSTGKVNDVSVLVGAHFTLAELVGTELAYGHFVLLSPVLVAKLDAYRDALGTGVSISSGYRSPAHQRAVCQGLRGQDSCPGTCAARSRHSWGDAADHGVFPTMTYSDAGCAARFNYVFREGDHVHLDLNPDHAICTVQIL